MNQQGQLGIGNTANQNKWQYVKSGLVAISASAYSSNAYDSNGGLFGWGWNSNGQIGDGTKLDRLVPTFVSAHPYTTGLGKSHGLHSLALSNRPISLVSVKLTPTSIQGGNPGTGTVTLTANAGAGGLVVTLSSSNSAAVVPPSVTVPAGTKTASFTITTKTVSAVTKPTITATLIVNKTTVLTVNP